MLDRPDWTGRTVVCVGSGPSLSKEDCELVRLSGHPVVVTNNTHEMCQWADVLFAFDSRWWRTYQDRVKGFKGRKLSGSILSVKYGAEPVQDWYSIYRNSGCCAVSVALAAGASRVILLGFDGGRFKNRAHWHADHPEGLGNADTVAIWPMLFGILAKRARRAGVQIINASRQTHLTAFKVARLEDVL